MPIYWTFKTLFDTGRYAIRYALHREEICVEGTGVWKFIQFGNCIEEDMSKGVGCDCDDEITLRKRKDLDEK